MSHAELLLAHLRLQTLGRAAHPISGDRVSPQPDGVQDPAAGHRRGREIDLPPADEDPTRRGLLGAAEKGTQKVRGRFSSEEAFVLLTQKPRVQFSPFARIYPNYSRCC